MELSMPNALKSVTVCKCQVLIMPLPCSASWTNTVSNFTESPCHWIHRSTSCMVNDLFLALYKMDLGLHIR